jgi:hypothetical protein
VSRTAAKDRAQEGGSKTTADASNKPQTVLECDELLRKVRRALQGEKLSEDERDKFMKYEAKVLERRHFLVQREQPAFLTGELVEDAFICVSRCCANFFDLWCSEVGAFK